MTKTIRAQVVGQALKLDEPIDLPDGTRVEVAVSTLNPEIPATSGEAQGTLSFLDVLSNANAHGPADWSTNLDHYLYGTERAE